MTLAHRPEDDAVFSFGDRILEALIYSFALYTACYHVALVSGASLGVLTAASFTLLAALLCLLVYRRTRIPSVPTAAGARAPRSAVALLGLLAVVGAGLGLFTVRPDADDVGYLARVVYSYEHPGEALFIGQPFAFVDSVPSFDLNHLPAYEHLCASIGLVSGISVLKVYHFLMPVLGGGLIPLVWFLLLRRLTRSTGAALYGTLGILLFLCAEGTTHRALGNFGFVRIWQGKALLMSVGTPVCVSYILEMLTASSITGALRLAAVSVAGIGLSITAVFLFPILFAVVASSYFLIELGKVPWKRVFLAGLSLAAYPAAGGLPFYQSARAFVATSDQELHWPNSLPGILEFVFGSPWGLTGLLSMTSLITLVLLRRRRPAAWIVLWAALLLVPLAPPASAAWVAGHLTSRNAFWRVLYALPLPLLIGMAAGFLFQRGSRQRAALILLAAAGTAGVLYLGTLTEGISPWAQPNVTFPVFRYKLPAEELAVSRQILRSLEDGPMLAARPISQTLPLFTSRFRQCDFRGYFMNDENRQLAHQLVSGRAGSGAAFSALAQVIEQPYRYVILSEKAVRRRRAVQILEQAGFHNRGKLGSSFTLFER